MSGLHHPTAAWPSGLIGLSGTTPIIVVGGTFDPPHLAHVALPQVIRDRVAPDAALLFVPAAASPFKQGVASTPALHRLAMLGLAIRGVPKAGIWTDEIDRARDSSPSYTVDTLRRLHELRPGAPLVLLIGADQAAAFHKWKDARGILALARVLVMPREPWGTREDLLDEMRRSKFWTDAELVRWESGFVDVLLDPVSATLIRERIRSGGVESAADLLDPAVREYIVRHQLYA